jgi:DNA adenine methylase
VLPNGKRFFDVFMGSGAVMLNIIGQPCIANDVNPDLLLPFKALQQDTPGFIAECATLFTSDTDTADAFYAIRNEFNLGKHDELRRAVCFIYLNRHSFNGLCRYNREGHFNASYAHDTPKFFPGEAMLACRDRIAACTFTNQDFREVFCHMEAGDVAYCDPPYLPLSSTADFNRYNVGHFSREDHADLAACAETAAARGVTVVISNHLTEDTRKLYRAVSHLHPITVGRAISCKANTRAAVSEAFFTFGGEPPIFYFQSCPVTKTRGSSQTGADTVM